MWSLRGALPAVDRPARRGVVGFASAQDGPPGITDADVVLPPFNPDAPRCTPPPGLRTVLAFAQDNEREFMQGVGRGLPPAAKDRGLDYPRRARRQRCRAG